MVFIAIFALFTFISVHFCVSDCFKMVNCAVIGCKSHSSAKIPDVTFHKFPKNENIRKLWQACTGRPQEWEPQSHSKICSKHFASHCIRRTAKQTFIDEASIPTLFIHDIPGAKLTEPSVNPKINEYPKRSEPETPEPEVGLNDNPKKRKLNMPVPESSVNSKSSAPPKRTQHDPEEEHTRSPEPNETSETSSCPSPLFVEIEPQEETNETISPKIKVEKEETGNLTLCINPLPLPQISVSSTNGMGCSTLRKAAPALKVNNKVAPRGINPTQQRQAIPDQGIILDSANESVKDAMHRGIVNKLESRIKHLERIAQERLQKLNSLRQKVRRLERRNKETNALLIEKIRMDMESEDSDEGPEL